MAPKFKFRYNLGRAVKDQISKNTSFIILLNCSLHCIVISEVFSRSEYEV